MLRESRAGGATGNDGELTAAAMEEEESVGRPAATYRAELVAERRWRSGLATAGAATPCKLGRRGWSRWIERATLSGLKNGKKKKKKKKEREERRREEREEGDKGGV
ncbi:hypothetical protein NL676_038863, partial [Syzygium grande]